MPCFNEDAALPLGGHDNQVFNKLAERVTK